MLKDIVVRLDGNKQDEVRIAHAEALASRHDAHLRGVYLNRMANLAVAADPSGAAAQVIIEQQKAAMQTGDEAMRTLHPRFGRLGVGNDLRRYDVFQWQAGQVLATEARTADLVVDLRLHGHAFEDAQTTEAAMFGAGRSALLVPPDSKSKPFKTVMVSWVNTREAARAVAEALPILKQAENVHVVMVEAGWGAPDPNEERGADLARHLDRHGVKVELVHAAGEDDTGTTLLTEATRLKADLLVMGGYGHSRFIEWALGGTTLDILTEAQLPVLVAH
ncbi:MAG: universal stress protein [Cucumibacter sp.]